MSPLTASAQAAGPQTLFAWVLGQPPADLTDTTEHEVTGPKSRNSVNGKNYVTRFGVGFYEVRFGGLGYVDGGTAQVMAVGADTAHCRIMLFQPHAENQRIFVACADLDGDAVDSWFTASFMRYFAGATAGPGRAYAWIDDPRGWTGDDTRSIVAHRADAAYDDLNANKYFNSTGSPIGFERVSEGSYKMRFFGQLATTMNWRITVDNFYDPTYCKITSILTPEMISIGCFDSDGLPNDVGFYVAYDAADVSASIVEAHGLVNGPGTAVTNVFAANGGTITVSHGPIPGFYVLKLPNVYSATSSGTVHVMAEHDGVHTGAFCKATGWAGNPVGIGVICFDTAGVLVDTPFSFGFMR